MFSRRSAWPLDDSDWQRARRDWQQSAADHRAGIPLDLTPTNPTQTSLAVDRQVLAELAAVDSRHYEPESCGLLCARQAVCQYYAERGHSLAPDHVLLGAGTSELYFHLLQLSCDVGDVVLVPSPGYPLLDVLADLAGVSLQRYPTSYDGQWYLDVAGLHAAVAEVQASGRRIGAIIAVSPNNPTGHIISADERACLISLCTAIAAVLIVDEVFADYRLQASSAPFSCLGASSALGFVLSGLSKVALLPQVKLAWAGGFGPAQPLQTAFERLEIAADAFLSVATPVQLAAGQLLQATRPTRAALNVRIHGNLATARELLTDTPIDLLHVTGGWSVIVRLPFLADEQAWPLDLLHTANILVSPGELYDLRPHEVVLSLLCEPDVWQAGLTRLHQRVIARLA